MKADHKNRRTRRNVDALHAATEREFTRANAAKYGQQPWGQFYHYVVMALAEHVTKPQMDVAIAKALRDTEAQETGCRNQREERPA